MKILILANNDIGLYKFRKELIEELLCKHQVILSLPIGGYVDKLIEMGCGFYETPINRRGKNPFNDFKLFMNYMNLIKSEKPDVVLSYTIKPNIYGGLACRLTGTPYITNITGLGSAVEKGGVLQKFTLFLYKMALKKSERVFFQNEENMELFKAEKIALCKHKLLPGSGVNLQQYSLLEYPNDYEIINFLFVGRVMKEKGIEQFLDAAQCIKYRHPHVNTNFHILGFCEEGYESILEELQVKGIIQYHGMQEDVREFHKSSHCTIHPTYYPEGMSNVLLESAACGRPIITTNRSGCREIVDHGVNGFLINKENSEDLITKIEVFLKMDYEEKKLMGMQGRRKIESEFDRTIVVNNYLEEIDRLTRRESIGV